VKIRNCKREKETIAISKMLGH